MTLLLASDGEMVIVGFVAMIITVVSVIAVQVRKTRQAAYDARLKQMMIERGMSSQEIRQVINARTRPGCREDSI